MFSMNHGFVKWIMLIFKLKRIEEEANANLFKINSQKATHLAPIFYRWKW